MWYAPVIPTVLVNGTEGIGTGFATRVPCYDPLDVLENVRRAIRNETLAPMVPWYKNFTGEVIPEKHSVLTFGAFDVKSHHGYDEVTITELPVGVWTGAYKETILAKLGESALSLVEYHTDTTVKFVIRIQRNEGFQGDFHSLLSLVKSISLNCMYFFDAHGKMKRFFDPRSVIMDFVPTRLDLYHKRKQALLKELSSQIKLHENQVNFIKGIISGDIVLHGKSRKVLTEELAKRGFDPSLKAGKNEGEAAAVEEAPETDAAGKDLARYDYLLNMRFSSLTVERVAKLTEQLQKLRAEKTTLEAHTAATLWEQDLKELEDFLATDPVWAKGQRKRDFSKDQIEVLNAALAQDQMKGEALEWDDSLGSLGEEGSEDAEGGALAARGKKNTASPISAEDLMSKIVGNLGARTEVVKATETTEMTSKATETTEVAPKATETETTEAAPKATKAKKATKIITQAKKETTTTTTAKKTTTKKTTKAKTVPKTTKITTKAPKAPKVKEEKGTKALPAHIAAMFK